MGVEDTQCPRCKKPLGTQHRTVVVEGVRQHEPPCPAPAYPTGEPAFPFLRDQNAGSTGGIPRKQHEDRNTQLPPRRPR